MMGRVRARLGKLVLLSCQHRTRLTQPHSCAYAISPAVQPTMQTKTGLGHILSLLEQDEPARWCPPPGDQA